MTTRLGMSATPSRNYAGFVAKSEFNYLNEYDLLYRLYIELIYRLNK